MAAPDRLRPRLKATASRRCGRDRRGRRCPAIPPRGPARVAPPPGDLSLREPILIAPVLGLIIFLGVYPKPVLDTITPAVQSTFRQIGTHDPVPTSIAISCRRAP